jgi:hypothetical protein
MTERDLFLALLDLPDAAAHSAFLARACDGDAALAAAGQGKDEAPLDEAAKAVLCCQVLDCLKAEQTAWSKLLKSGSPQQRSFIVQSLSHWQKDTDLASIRDEAALAKLSADERMALAQLWADGRVTQECGGGAEIEAVWPECEWNKVFPQIRARLLDPKNISWPQTNVHFADESSSP